LLSTNVQCNTALFLVLPFVYSAVICYHLCSNAYASRLISVLSNLLSALKYTVAGSTRLVGGNIGWGVLAVLDMPYWGVLAVFSNY
jgi:hypothetical protein